MDGDDSSLPCVPDGTRTEYLSIVGNWIIQRSFCCFDHIQANILQFLLLLLHFTITNLSFIILLFRTTPKHCLAMAQSRYFRNVCVGILPDTLLFQRYVLLLIKRLYLSN